MLNNSRWDFFNPSDIKCLKGAFSDFSVFLAAYFKAAIDERNTENAVMVAHQHIWKTLTPTFEM
jgi:hypothetical protein